MTLKVIKKYFLTISVFLALISAQVWAEMPYVRGVDYSPTHYNGYYDDVNKNLAISDDDIEKDFFLMSKNFDAVRTYEYDPINLQRILRTAKRYDMKMVVGIGIDPLDKNYTDAQVSGLKQLFEQYPDLLDPVIAIVVGDEVIRDTGNEKNISYLIQQYNTIAKFSWMEKNSNRITLSISETDDTFASKAGKILLKNLPRKTPVFININPYLSGCSVTAAIGGSDETCKGSSFPDRWKRLLSIPELNEHQIIIGESGWPTEGPGAIVPIPTRSGSLTDAVDYYNFLYPFLEKQTINNKPVKVPLFSFVAFDEPMNGVFGFASNFWGVYNFDSTTKYGMIYPYPDITKTERSIKPTPKLGTNLKVYLLNENYNNAKLPVQLKTNGNIYSNKINASQNPKNKLHQIKNWIVKKTEMTKNPYSLMNENDYPFVEYSHNNSNPVTLILPDGGSEYPATKCTNELLSGNGYGTKSELNLKWARSFSNEEHCQYVNWAQNGIFIIGKDKK